MSDDNDLLRIQNLYDREVTRDMIEIKTAKDRFIRDIQQGLGQAINDIESYKKPEPTIWQKINTKIKKIFRAL